MRKASQNDFIVAVDGVGQFTFARRKMKDEIAIQVEYARILDGVQPTEWLEIVAGSMSALKVLTVKAPEGWDLDELDPLDEDSYAKLIKAHNALVRKEASFRGPVGTDGKDTGQGIGEDGGVLVPSKVQPDE